ncbi:unnamed protein product [Cladocopium goreaui]|uniref:Uncharacterized protein n=1 Tax=Cladocopium goreaui TaxID=2562237 RepID=A0A9P1GAY2_9DINO|nr:unnamed protein product [Cladocopium goreaui]
MAELATFPAMESSYELLESLRIQLPDYEICRVSDTKMTLLAGVPLDFLMYHCKWCCGVYFAFHLTFQTDSTILEDHIDTKYDCKVHERECNEQRERVKAKVKTGISLHLAIKNEKSPSHGPMTIGKAEQLMSYEISFTKNGPLGLSLNEEPGRMKVLKVKPEEFFENFNRLHPQSAVNEGDYLLEVQGETPSFDQIHGLKDGDKVRVKIATPRVPQPHQHTMGDV